MIIKNLLKFALLLLLPLGGCTTLPPSMPSTGGIPLQDICKQYNVQWDFDTVTQVVILEYKNRKAKALIGSNVVVMDQTKISLDAPMRRINSTIYVSSDFADKVIGYFGATSSRTGFGGTASNLKFRTIVVDAGHGGKDPGARGPGGVREKDVVLDIAKRLRAILTDAGVKVIMTRDTDEFITLNNRTEISSKANADLFVSIHANSNPSRRMEGVEVYTAKTKEKKDLDEEQRRKNERLLLKKLDASMTTPAIGPIVSDMMYQLKQAESQKLAMRLVRDISNAAKTSNRGARHARFFVVRNTLMPAVLIETGFLTNKQEEKRLNSSEYRKKLAEIIARSILSYGSSS